MRTGAVGRRLRSTLQQLRPAVTQATAVTTLQICSTPEEDLLPEPETHPTQAQRESFNDQGFLVVDDMCDPADLAPLLAETRRIVHGVWDGSLPRGDPGLTGLPSFGDEPEKTWAIRGLLSPYFASSVFADYFCSEPVLRYTRGFLRQSEEKWMMGDCLIFTSPDVEGVPGIGWHRDIQQGAAGYRLAPSESADNSEVSERELWRYAEEAHAAHVDGRPRLVIAWHLALVDDCSVECVPQSHYEFRTAAQQAAMGAAERSSGGKPMPGAVAINLKAGQAVFWTGALLHRGNMRYDKERMTLECHWACPPPVPPPVGPNGWFGPVGKHWLLKDGVRDSFNSPVLKQAYDNWCNSPFRGHVVQ